MAYHRYLYRIQKFLIKTQHKIKIKRFQFRNKINSIKIKELLHKI